MFFTAMFTCMYFKSQCCVSLFVLWPISWSRWREWRRYPEHRVRPCCCRGIFTWCPSWITMTAAEAGQSRCLFLPPSPRLFIGAHVSLEAPPRGYRVPRWYHLLDPTHRLQMVVCCIHILAIIRAILGATWFAFTGCDPLFLLHSGPEPGACEYPTPTQCLAAWSRPEKDQLQPLQEFGSRVSLQFVSVWLRPLLVKTPSNCVWLLSDGRKETVLHRRRLLHNLCDRNLNHLKASLNYFLFTSFLCVQLFSCFIYPLYFMDPWW